MKTEKVITEEILEDWSRQAPKAKLGNTAKRWSPLEAVATDKGWSVVATLLESGAGFPEIADWLDERTRNYVKVATKDDQKATSEGSEKKLQKFFTADSLRRAFRVETSRRYMAKPSESEAARLTKLMQMFGWLDGRKSGTRQSSVKIKGGESTKREPENSTGTAGSKLGEGPSPSPRDSQTVGPNEREHSEPESQNGIENSAADAKDNPGKYNPSPDEQASQASSPDGKGAKAPERSDSNSGPADSAAAGTETTHEGQEERHIIKGNTYPLKKDLRLKGTKWDKEKKFWYCCDPAKAREIQEFVDKNADNHRSGRS